MRYRYSHRLTEAGTGYFSCDPEKTPDLDEALAMLAQRPLDDFLRRHILYRAVRLDPALLAAALAAALAATRKEGQEALTTLCRELLLLNPALASQTFFAQYDNADKSGESKDNANKNGAEYNKPSTGGADSTIAKYSDADDSAKAATSLVLLRREALPDKELHRRWGEFFRANMRAHRAFKTFSGPDLPPLYPAEGQPLSGPGTTRAFSAPFRVCLADLHGEHAARSCAGQDSASLAAENTTPAKDSSTLAKDTAALAEDRLNRLGLIAGKEMRHTASLSPVALLRPWNLHLSVALDRHAFSLSGQGTTYGRGLSLAAARVSCLMEMVERSSCHVSVDADGVLDRPGGPRPLLRGSHREIEAAHGPALDLGDFPLDVPYAGQELYWIEGHAPDGRPVWVPLQMAALFCNLDEVSLSEAHGSTGIAAGLSPEQAKVAALLEVFERDAEATSLFIKERCFRLQADEKDDPLLAALLADYAARGINVHFQDLTGPAGVPVCQCFVMSPKGVPALGHGAALSLAKAALAALTETPFPYPEGGPSGPMLRNLPLRNVRDLPDYSLGSHAADLALLEDLLARNQRSPLYVDMTRQGLDFPVLRALVPGFELCADLDGQARVPLRLYRAWEAFRREREEVT